MKRRVFLSFLLAVVLDSSLTPRPDAAEVSAQDHKIVALDVINVDVVGEKDLSKELRVSSSGTITFPFLGVLEVRDRTPAQVEAMLKQLLEKDYLVNPQVIVTVKEYRVRTVSVLGHVNKPGLVAIPSEQRVDVLEAIAQAGDFSKTANKNRIEVTRNGVPHRFSLAELQKVTAPDKKFWLEPGDVIIVHESFF